MATHSSILARRIPRTEEPGGLQSMGSQRVGHSWATNIPPHLFPPFHLNINMIHLSQLMNWLIIWASLVAQLVKNLPVIQETGLGKSLENRTATHPLQYSYLQNFMDRGAWRATLSMGSQRVGPGRLSLHTENTIDWSPQLIQIAFVFTWCLFSFEDPIQNTLKVPLGYDSFSDFLTVLRSTGQVFGRMPLSWDLPSVLILKVMSFWGGRPQVKCWSHVISRVHTTSITWLDSGLHFCIVKLLPLLCSRTRSAQRPL